MTYKEKAAQLADILRQKLTKEEYEMLIELMSDDDTYRWLIILCIEKTIS